MFLPFITGFCVEKAEGRRNPRLKTIPVNAERLYLSNALGDLILGIFTESSAISFEKCALRNRQSLDGAIVFFGWGCVD